MKNFLPLITNNGLARWTSNSKVVGSSPIEGDSFVSAFLYSTVTCEPAERSRFKTNNACLGGTFGLISQDEVERLMEFRASKRARPTVATTESCSSAETITTTELSTDQVSTTINSTIVGEREMSRDIVVYSDSSESENETLRVKSPVMPSTPEVQCTPETAHAPRGNQLRLTGSACINKVILLLLIIMF